MAAHRACSRQLGLGRHEVVADTLVRPFMMIMMEERADGGYTLKIGDQIIGGIRVSGGHYAQDVEVAARLAALGA